MFLALFILQFYHGEYRRLKHEGGHQDPLLGAGSTSSSNTDSDPALDGFQSRF